MSTSQWVKRRDGISAWSGDSYFDVLSGRNGVASESQVAVSQVAAAGSFRAIPLGAMAILFIACSISLLASGYLALATLTSSPILGCNGSFFDCGTVLASKWSSLWGMPVSALAIGVDTLILSALLAITSWPTARGRNFAARVLVVACSTALFAAVWFTALQIFAVGHLCIYCLVAHACSVVMAVTAFIIVRLSVAAKIRAATLAVIPSLALMGLQIAQAAPPTYEIEHTPIQVAPQRPLNSDEQGPLQLFSAPGEDKDASRHRTAPAQSPGVKFADALLGVSPRFLPRVPHSSLAGIIVAGDPIGCGGARQDEASDGEASRANSNEEKNDGNIVVVAGRFQLDASKWPIVGDPTAKTVLVEMYDYTCPHCRRNHRWVREAYEASTQEFALISLAVPMNRQCNPAVNNTDVKHRDACRLAELSVAVWLRGPEKFVEFHEWLFAGERAPSAAEATARAESLVGKQALDEVLQSGKPSQYLAKQVELYRLVGSGTVPKLLLSESIVNGEIGSAERLLQMVRQGR